MDVSAVSPDGQVAAALPTESVADPATQGAQEFLSFKLGDEEYGIDILQVQEIRSYEPPTRMANSPPFMKGVINLRGVIVPIIDMRLKFNLEHVSYNSFTVVIVLNIGHQVVGMVVDGVSDVISLTPAQLHPVPEFHSTIDSDHVIAIGSVEDRMLVLLDIEKLLGETDICLVAEPRQ